MTQVEKHDRAPSLYLPDQLHFSTGKSNRKLPQKRRAKQTMRQCQISGGRQGPSGPRGDSPFPTAHNRQGGSGRSGDPERCPGTSTCHRGSRGCGGAPGCGGGGGWAGPRPPVALAPPDSGLTCWAGRGSGGAGGHERTASRPPASRRFGSFPGATPRAPARQYRVTARAGART